MEGGWSLLVMQKVFCVFCAVVMHICNRAKSKLKLCNTNVHTVSAFGFANNIFC